MKIYCWIVFGLVVMGLEVSAQTIKVDAIDGGGGRSSVTSFRLYGEIGPYGLPSNSQTRSQSASNRLYNGFLPSLIAQINQGKAGADPAWLELSWLLRDEPKTLTRIAMLEGREPPAFAMKNREGPFR